ncbi:MAG: ROK family protein [Hyphomicrobium sp.]|jgi:predicted NBD/HSP70 family sugar kinase|uniref:ROK family protein n=1 Tax=Hyphomicrobium sp. TaxID=82 RepID=UPI0025C681D1|nr:ROK family protein [Hyphomicrobium sp.]MBX9863123.1 ROK family protein [Hyphomicrobium sp.]
MEGGLYAGIFIERERVRVCVARHTGNDHVSGGSRPRAEVIDGKTFTKGAADMLAAAGEWLARNHPEVAGIGIGGFGPFVSLDPVDADEDYAGGTYGLVDPRRADQPFRGVNLPAVISDAFIEQGVPVPAIAVHTDACVGALGDAWLRGVTDCEANNVTVFLMLTDGVGAGYVSGLSIIRGGLHPEMGLIDVSLFDDDPLLNTDLGDRSDLGCVASARAMIERAKELGFDVESIDDVYDIEHKQLWPVWARYVARACLVCTAMLSPKRIALGGPMMQNKFALKAIQARFHDLWVDRCDGPAFDYEGLHEIDYIEKASRQGDLDAMIGGAVCLAISAKRPTSWTGQNVVPIVKKRSSGDIEA